MRVILLSFGSFPMVRKRHMIISTENINQSLGIRLKFCSRFLRIKKIVGFRVIQNRVKENIRNRRIGEKKIGKRSKKFYYYDFMLQR